MKPSGSGADPTGGAVVTFVIEKIVVEGVGHGSEKIVASETLLLPGNAYTEAQLRQALHRVERLPFVVEADFALRRGTARGRFELVVSVTQTRPLFFGGLVSLVRHHDAYGFVGSTEVAFVPEVGGRAFFGGYNEVTGTVRGFVAGGRGFDALGDATLLYDASYRHHNVFGRQVVGTAFFSKPGSFTKEVGADLAFPLSRVSALKLSFGHERNRWRACAQTCGDSRTTTNHLGLSWLRDTTDDPFTPRQGQRLESALGYSHDQSRHLFDFDRLAPLPQTIDPAAPPRIETGSHDTVDVALAARRYWPVSTGAALGIGARIVGGRGAGDSVITQGTALVRTVLSRGFFGSTTVDAEMIGNPKRLGRGSTQFWWVLGASAWGQWTRFDYDSDSPLGYETADSRFGSARVSCGLALRGRWGIARFELSYEYRFKDHSSIR